MEQPNNESKINRREFLKRAGTVAAGLAIGGERLLSGKDKAEAASEIEKPTSKSVDDYKIKIETIKKKEALNESDLEGIQSAVSQLTADLEEEKKKLTIAIDEEEKKRAELKDKLLDPQVSEKIRENCKEAMGVLSIEITKMYSIRVPVRNMIDDLERYKERIADEKIFIKDIKKANEVFHLEVDISESIRNLLEESPL